MLPINVRKLPQPLRNKKMASDKNHRPCLPLKPQEKVYFPARFSNKVKYN